MTGGRASWPIGQRRGRKNAAEKKKPRPEGPTYINPLFAFVGCIPGTGLARGCVVAVERANLRILRARALMLTPSPNNHATIVFNIRISKHSSTRRKGAEGTVLRRSASNRRRRGRRRVGRRRERAPQAHAGVIKPRGAFTPLAPVTRVDQRRPLNEADFIQSVLHLRNRSTRRCTRVMNSATLTASPTMCPYSSSMEVGTGSALDVPRTPDPPQRRRR